MTPECETLTVPVGGAEKLLLLPKGSNALPRCHWPPRKGGHRGPQHFKIGGTFASHEWMCSRCGKVSVWKEGWQYHGSIECPKCWLPAITFVACSDKCASELTPECETRQDQR